MMSLSCVSNPGEWVFKSPTVPLRRARPPDISPDTHYGLPTVAIIHRWPELGTLSHALRVLRCLWSRAFQYLSNLATRAAQARSRLLRSLTQTCPPDQ